MDAQNPTAHYTDCLSRLARYKRNSRIRVAVLAVLLIAGLYLAVASLSLAHMLVTILCSVGILAMAVALITPEKPVPYIVFLVLLVFLTLTGVFPWETGIPEIVVYLTAIPEYLKMRWIMQQPGYPHFSERLDQQTAHSEYEPVQHDAPAPQDITAEMLPLEMPDADTENLPEQDT